jgi:predicted kinase
LTDAPAEGGPRGPEAVVFVGIQAAGKSTFYAERFFRTHVRLNLDMLRTRHREALLLRACLEAQQSFVVDNTNPTATDRARYVGPARAAGFRVVGYFFETTAGDALRRNAGRPAPQRVPPMGLFGTLKALQPPTFAEGFDALYRVTLDETRGFVIAAWGPDA